MGEQRRRFFRVNVKLITFIKVIEDLQKVMNAAGDGGYDLKFLDTQGQDGPRFAVFSRPVTEAPETLPENPPHTI